MGNIDKHKKIIVRKSNSINNNDVLDLQKVKNYIVMFSTLIVILSALGTVLVKLISLGRYFYFDFDLEYCDLSSNKLTVGTFVICFVIFVISILISVTTNIIVSKSFNDLNTKDKSKVKKKVYKFIISVIIILSDIFIICMLCYIIIPNLSFRILIAAYSIVFTLIFYCIIYIFGGIRSKKGAFKIAIVLSALIIFLMIFSQIRIEYDEAKAQRDFQIINYQSQDYIVISKGKEEYSAYMCRIYGDDVILYTNRHKYFDIDTKTYYITFKEVTMRDQETITPDEYRNNVKKYLD